MLTGIPKIISPDLMKIIMEMGHGDELVFADGNFPALGYPQRITRCDGHTVTPLLDAIMHFFPLDSFVKNPVALMDVVAGDNYKPEIWPVYKSVIQKYQPEFGDFEFMDRFKFYERTKNAYAIVTTCEMSRYANIILKKGLVTT